MPPITHGASTVEVYGFVVYITSATAYVLYLLWAFIPEHYLKAVGISYYPTKHWALAIPAWIIFTGIYTYWLYEGFNLASVKPFNSRLRVEDSVTKPPASVGLKSLSHSTAVSVPPLCHMPPHVVSRVLYSGKSFQEVQEEPAVKAYFK